MAEPTIWQQKKGVGKFQMIVVWVHNSDIQVKFLVLNCKSFSKVLSKRIPHLKVGQVEVKGISLKVALNLHLKTET